MKCHGRRNSHNMAFPSADPVDVRLTAEQRSLLQYVFAFREHCGDDYYSNRLLSHFLLHCGSGLNGNRSRSPVWSEVQSPHGFAPARGLFQGSDVQAAPAFAWRAGPTASCCPPRSMPAPHRRVHLDACRRHSTTTFSTSSSVPGACVSRPVALHHFCKKFGLDPGHARPKPQRPGPSARACTAGRATSP